MLDGPLAAIGFERLPYEHDHVPAGPVDDPERWVKRLFARRNHPDGDVNLHVRVAGSPNERLALLFRDWFRAHPEAVPAYAAFKRVLAAEVGDIGVYSDVKDPGRRPRHRRRGDLGRDHRLEPAAIEADSDSLVTQCPLRALDDQRVRREP